MYATSKALNIKGDPYGIRNGWFNFPWNFDPVWLDNCDGFQEVSGSEEEEYPLKDR